MLKVKKDRVVEWPVTVSQAENGGTASEAEFTVMYKLMKRSDRQSLNQLRNAYQLAIGGKEEAKAKAALLDKFAEHIVGWSGVVDADGDTPIAYNRENLEAFLDDETISNAIEIGLIQASAGAAVKNLETGSDSQARKAADPVIA